MRERPKQRPFGEMVDAADSKSAPIETGCRFESDKGHNL